MGQRLCRGGARAVAPTRRGGDGGDRCRAPHCRQDYVHLAASRVHAAQRADGRRAREARVSRQGHGGQSRGHPEARHARRSRTRRPAAAGDAARGARGRRVGRRRVRRRPEGVRSDRRARWPLARRRSGRDVRRHRPRWRGKDDAAPAGVRSGRPRPGRRSALRRRSVSRAAAGGRSHRLRVAALQSLRRSVDRREHRILRPDPWRPRLSGPPRSSARR